MLTFAKEAKSMRVGGNKIKEMALDMRSTKMEMYTEACLKITSHTARETIPGLMAKLTMVST